MKAAELLIRCLEAEGVEYVFGLPGEETLDLTEALRTARVRFITVRHEQAAAFMADAYGRLTGRAGVCLATLGPGATNLATGIADATLDHAPVVAITGQAGLERVHKESHQYVDLIEAFRPLTKWNTRVEKAVVIPEVIRKAFKLAQAERPGTCHIEVPEDVAGEMAEAHPLTPSRLTYPGPDEAMLTAAARLIEAARAPMILAGNGVIRNRASEELRRFASKTNIPVVHTFMGKGIIPDDHPLSLRTVGLQLRDYAACGFDDADLVITVGYDHVEYAPQFWNPKGDKRVLHIDMVPAEVDEHYPVAVEVVADIKKTLALLTEHVRGAKDASHTLALRQYIERALEEGATDQGMPMKPQRILHEVRRVLGRADVVISDVGAHKLWVARLYPAYEPNTVLISNGFAAMGFALPAAIAAKLILPDRRVVVVSGDGGFMMNCQELETAQRLGVAFVTLILNDGAYGSIAWKQQMRFGKSFGVTFTNPDFVKLAEAFGAKGYRVEAPDELAPALAEALAQRVPAVIDCPVDYGENARLAERLGQMICPL